MFIDPFIDPFAMKDGDDSYLSSLGVGIAVPTHLLHVDGADTAARIFVNENTSDIGDSSAYLFGVHPTGLYAKAGIFFQDTTDYARGNLLFAVDSIGDNNAVQESDVKMIILNNGNVGINNVAPSTKLEVGGIITSTGLYPAVDNASDLGDIGGTKYWRHLALKGNITDGGGSTLTVAAAKAAYDHSLDNTQAHSDYMLNAGDIGTGNYALGNVLYISDSFDQVSIGATVSNDGPKLRVQGTQSGEKYSTFLVETTTGHGYFVMHQATASGKNVGTLLYVNDVLKWYGPDYVAESYLRYHGPGGAMLHLYDNGNVYLPSVPDTAADEVNLQIDTTTGLLSIPTSSLRYKENIRDLDDSDRVYQLRPVKYDVKGGGPKDQIGLIAEEVVEVFPEIISYKRRPIIGMDNSLVEPKEGIIGYEKTDTPQTVSYQKLVVPLIKEVQRMRIELNQLLET